jgi:GDP-mannose 6-dehydrogenase
MRELYGGLAGPVIVTEIPVAEMIKYINNSFHALKVVFANEIGNICRDLGVDSHELMRIFCMDNKLNLSPYYLKPGFAYGGSCLPKDLKALCTIAHDLYVRCPVLESIHTSNELQKEMVLSRVLSLGKRRIGFLGLSFKAGTDDLRSSPIIDVLEKLLGKGYQISVYDKNVQLSELMGTNRAYILEKIPLISRFIASNPMSVIESSDVIVVVNHDGEYSDLVADASQGKVVYDLTRITDGVYASNYAA